MDESLPSSPPPSSPAPPSPPPPANLHRVELFDNTRVNAARTCMRYFYYAHVRDWQPDSKRLPLIFGSAWHASMDVIWAHHAELASLWTSAPSRKVIDGRKEIADKAFDAFVGEWTEGGMPPPAELSPDDLEDLSPKHPFIAMEMIYNYAEHRASFFAQPGFELIDIERPFAVPMDPNDKKLFYVGRMDKVFRINKDIYCGEHKSSGAYRKNGPFREEFLESFSPNSQIDGYLFAGRIDFGEHFKAVYVDAALTHKQVHDGFRFIPVERQHAQIDAWLWETHTWIDQIHGNMQALRERSGDRSAPYLAAFPKNTSSCGNFGRCPYLDLCKMLPNPERQKEPPLGYKTSHWSPFDEIKLEKLGVHGGDGWRGVPSAQ